MTGAVHPRILGSLGSADGTGVVRIEDRYDTDIDDLWEALTDPTRLARWYAGAACAICGKGIEVVRWFHRPPGMLGADGSIRSCRDLTVEELPDLFATARPICFDCCVAETFRARFPELVVEAPHIPALRPREGRSGNAA